ncbi:TetR/AcrR family transcriptional regulator [Amorphus sp. 3PC139-8]|uniref:TetR/AcrR family transcriptional regulator n=1 Tax=Amorphus sp. 3PC139-8 TaxID=2735676 RepID=UPI00345D6459
MENASDKPEGRRAQKRRETHQRIVDTGLSLFLRHGYEATTIDMIAKAAGISRRSFFSYFGSKEDVLLARVGSGFPEALRLAMAEQSSQMTPLETARQCFIKLASRYETDESAAVDRLLQSTVALRARKNALFLEIEQTLADGMHALWPEQECRTELRLAAMAAVGALRLALEDRRNDDDGQPLEYYLDRNFALLAELS